MSTSFLKPMKYSVPPLAIGTFRSAPSRCTELDPIRAYPVTRQVYP